MRYTLTLLSAIFVAGCTQDKTEMTVSHKIPLLAECVLTVEAAKDHFVRTSAKKAHSLDIKIEKFDQVHHFYNGPIGVATLLSTDGWQTLDGGSPKAYLELTANGIFADCAPISMTSIKLDDAPDLTVKSLAYIAQKEGAKNIDISTEEVIMTYNDGSYDYPF